jgi:hypothetical protein
MTATQSGCYPLGGTVSMRQNDLTPLDLIAGETRRRLAMRTDDRRLARDCYAEVWTVTRINGLLECDKSLALQIGATNGEIPLRRCTKIKVIARRSDGASRIPLERLLVAKIT